MTPGEERLLLFSRARSGEEEAFAEIVTAYENFVYRIAIGITGQKEDAEDVTQETFLRLWQILDEFVWIDQPDAYIARMAKNAAIDLVRRRNRRQTQPFVGEDGEADAFAWDLPDDDPDNAPDAAVLSGERQRELENAIAQLKKPHREILRMRVDEGMDYAEIAKRLEISEGTVRSRLARARTALRKILRKGNFFPDNTSE